MAPAKRRVSYILPAPTDPPRRLVLPPPNASRLGLVNPLLIADTVQPVADHHHRSRYPRHRLGVAALALDTSTQLSTRPAPEGILYTAGRDGLLLSWDLGLSLRPRATSDSPLRRGRWESLTGWADDAIDEEAEETDERPTSDGDILGDVAAMTARRRRPSAGIRELPYEEKWELDPDATPRTTSFRQCAQTHTDWVNDILLCNYNQTVVSASSDGTVQAWTPHAPNAPHPTTIGTHSDYARCLAACRTQNWIASGSFDRTIKLWDLSRGQSTPNAEPLTTLHPADPQAAKCSVYALAADPFGHAVASGGPERVVRMWDPRSGKRSGKLVGHTDNIRAILLSEDAKYLLTGSADASIKLWSLATQRCLHTFTHHADSVWSLFSAHPALETFYAGDRAGLVSRVDVSRITRDVGEGECVLVCRDGGENWGTPGSPSEPLPKLGPQIRKPQANLGQGGINKLVVVDDTLVWTATSASTVRRWRIPSRGSAPTASASGFGFGGGSNSAARLSPNEQESEWDLREGRSLAPSVLSYDDDGDDEGGLTRNGIPYASLVRLTNSHDPFPARSVGGAGSSSGIRERDAEVATLYSAASVVSVPPLRSPLYASANSVSGHTNNLLSPLRSAPLPSTRAAYFARELAAEASPLASVPDSVGAGGSIAGERGLVRALILNDRVHAVSVDTGGEVAVWDLVRGTCLGVYGREALGWDSGGGGSTGGQQQNEEWSPREALERVRERIEGEAVVASWATVDTKAGVLAVHVNERSFESEIYADEVGYAGDRRFGDEAKLNLGKWVLRNLFLGFIREEQRIRHRPRRDSQDTASSVPRGSSPHRPHHQHRTSVGSDVSSSSRRRPSLSSEPTARQTRRLSSSNSTVLCASKMLPALPPQTENTPPPSTSPLLTPLIPLYGRPLSATAGTGTLASLVMPSIPASPAVGVNDATPMPMQPQRRVRTATLENGKDGKEKETAGDYFGSRTRQTSMHGATTPGADDFSGWSGPGSSGAPVPSTPTGLMGRLKSFGKSKRTADHATPALPTTVELPVVEEVAPEPVVKTPLQQLLSGPLSPPPSSEAPTLGLSPHIPLLIEEEASPGFTTVYRGTVGSTAADIHSLESAMPMWLIEYLLLHHLPTPPPQVKISFVLLPWTGKDNEESLPELLNTQQSKLTASRFLRVRKLVAHVQEKLDKLDPPPADAPRPRAEDLYEILCNDVVLPLDMSIAAVRQYVWRQSAELVMNYRTRREMAAYRRRSRG
ncbi:WD-repeats-region domain-containing protein [Favolaschia claudopus]|uniref:WD-repeats-region domain-containing protein n=1 Tax=Favolaschia claudopus TaxID=2862362 RepID=A0AAW0AHP7_9AGAR